MFKEKFEKVKSLFVKNSDGNNKKKIENLVVFIIILVITVIAINVIWSDNKQQSQHKDTNNYKQLALSDTQNNTTIQQIDISDEDNLEKNLENILSKIEGVGKVSVLITYSESSQIIAMYNENSKQSSTEETDQQGGNRIIKEVDISKDIIYKEENGEKVPITQKVIKPRVEGAIIIAQGASNINIKTSIIQAVEAVTGVATHKVQVFEMKDE